MPLKIIRDDITKVKADAIVNTANPYPRYAAGTDRAVYETAGADQLLAQRKRIGIISEGQVAVTDAFALPARFIIHTVGPQWKDGNSGEFDILRACYANSLQKAYDLGCDSVAFPLIATGVYGFPKDQALQTAVSCIGSFLMHHELLVLLVVFDMDSYQLSTRFMGQVQSFIDETRIAEAVKKEYSIQSENRIERNVFCSCRKEEPSHFGSSFQDELASLSVAQTLEDTKTFQEKMFEIMEEKGMVSTDVYKAANIDRKLFSKIQCNKEYHPKKKTAMAICIALRLDMEQSKDLLARADWAFSPNRKMDLVIMAAIANHMYDINEINEVLFAMDLDLLA